MRKLLRAGYSNIRKMKIFWVGIFVLAGSGLLVMIENYRMAAKYDDMPELMPQYFAEALFNHVSFIGIVAAVFISLFVGMEYSDGTVRNKLVAGQSRTKIYLANYVNCAVAGAFQAFLSSVIIWAGGFLLMGMPRIGLDEFLWACVFLLFICIAYAAIYNFFSMMISGRAYASILNVLLSVAFIVIALYLYSKLSIPEMMQPYIMIGNDGSMEQVAGEMGAVPNPHYISGLQRDIYQFLLEFLPGGQSIQMMDYSLLQEALKRPFVPCLYSTIVAAAFNLAGIALFRRKDIK